MRALWVGNPRITLVVAPHPDDEAIGAYGLIRRLRRAGRRVKILVVADGAASHPASPTWPPTRLVAERRRETRRAMLSVGVTAGDINFLGLPDGALGAGHASAITRAARLVPQLELLVAPAASDAHPDHRAVALALARAQLPGVRRLSYLVWGKRGKGRALFLREARCMKRAAIRRYRTQMGLIPDDPEGFSIARHELNAFTRPTEIFVEERRCGQSR